VIASLDEAWWSHVLKTVKFLNVDLIGSTEGFTAWADTDHVKGFDFNKIWKFNLTLAH